MFSQVTIQRTDNGFVSWGLDGVLVYHDPEPVHLVVDGRDGLQWELTAQVVETGEAPAE